MKIKQMIKWNWQNSYMGLIVLYGVFILLYLFAFAVNVSAGGETVNVNGMSTGSVVMMLVYGIVLFSQSLSFWFRCSRITAPMCCCCCSATSTASSSPPGCP